MPACSARSTRRATWCCAAPSPTRCACAACAAFPCCSSTIPAEPVGVWLELREDRHGLYARGKLIPEVRARAGTAVAVARGRHRRAVDRLPHGEGHDRSAHPHPPAGRGRSLGNFHRHLPAARGGARARGEAGSLPAEAVTRSHARRAGMGADARRAERGGISRTAGAAAARSRERIGPRQVVARLASRPFKAARRTCAEAFSSLHASRPAQGRD